MEIELRKSKGRGAWSIDGRHGWLGYIVLSPEPDDEGGEPDILAVCEALGAWAKGKRAAGKAAR